MQCRIAFITGCGLWRVENRWGFWHSGRSRCKFCAFGNQEVVETLTQEKECLISFPSTFLGKWRPQKWKQKRPEVLNLSLSVTDWCWLSSVWWECSAMYSANPQSQHLLVEIPLWNTENNVPEQLFMLRVSMKVSCWGERQPNLTCATFACLVVANNLPHSWKSLDLEALHLA